MALLKWLYPGMRVKRWFFLFTGGVVASGFSLALLLNYKFIGAVEGTLFSFVYRARLGADFGRRGGVGARFDDDGLRDASHHPLDCRGGGAGRD